MLGALLRSLRERRGMPMAEVIEALGVPRSTAYYWESASSRPDPVDLKRLLDLYEATDAEQLRAWELRSQPIESSESAESAA